MDWRGPFDEVILSDSRFGFRVKRLLPIRFVKPSFLVKWRWGTKKQDSRVRDENRGVGTAEEIVTWDFWLDISFQVQTAQNSFVRFATGQLYPIDDIVKNDGNIPRPINPKH